MLVVQCVCNTAKKYNYIAVLIHVPLLHSHLDLATRGAEAMADQAEERN